MKIIKGVSASKGIAIGKVKFNKSNSLNFTKETIENIENEIKRYEKAKEKTISSLNELYEKSLKDIGENEAQIFQIHAMMLEDLDYNESVVGIITEQKVNAEYAVSETSKIFSKMFSSLEDEYMKERGADILDISAAVIKNLLGIEDLIITHSSPYILAAKDLLPSETIVLDKTQVEAFITKKGSKISHSAILARTMGIPAIVGLDEDFGDIKPNTEIIVNGFTGEIYIEPDDETVEKFKKEKQLYLKKREKLKHLIGKKAITKDGIKIDINANIGYPSDIKLVAENDADGIGLFRSEFLYMESEDFPTEEQQFNAYKKILQEMKNKPVIIRTLDLGADKHVPYFNLDNEDNPALGFRAVRISLAKPDIFKTQLRALYRASNFGNLSIMVPMITSTEEVQKVKDIVGIVKDELASEGQKYKDNVPLGIMIETPAAVIVSDLLARHVDFFSIGTNDLTQYTMAADRMNSKVEHIFDPRDVAILRMIKTVVDNGEKAGIWTGICGESASDLELIEFYLAIGVKELSVTPTAILDVRDKVINTDLKGRKDDLIKNLIEK
ncbi:MAG: phosphoenolpyruvate--protein phosphotransferase [Oscillospiraceae bacterium]